MISLFTRKKKNKIKPTADETIRWSIPNESYCHQTDDKAINKQKLEDLGFIVIGDNIDPSYFLVHPPVGWTRKTVDSYNTLIYDRDGNNRINVFRKRSDHEKEAFIAFPK